MATLPHLPIEVATIIFTELRPRDWLSLRRTCKGINAKTAHLFTKSFFKKRVVMLERRSLQCLESIATHHALSQSVEELEICTSHLLPLDEVREIEPPYSEYENMMKSLRGKITPAELGIDYDEWYDRWQINNGEGDSSDSDDADDADDDDGDGDTERDRLRRLNASEYRKRLYDQEDVMQSRYDVKCLTQAMAHFKRCKHINISSSIQAWGLNRLRRSIGILPQRGLTFESKESTRLVRHIIHVVLTAVAASKIQVEVLNIGPEGMLMNSNRVSPFMLMGPSSAILVESPPFSLRRLQISLDPNVPQHVPVSSKWDSDLIRFIKLLPELSYLELVFEERDEMGRFSELGKELYIPKLEKLMLSCIDCAREDIALCLIRHRRTLREVVLDSIQLAGNTASWRWLIEIIRDSLDLVSLSIESSGAKEEVGVSRFIDLDDMQATDIQGLTEIISILAAKI
ncbi:F-box domain-containing protein [Fusarium falciforme]|uniref:F-box domain-containing protein n=1 Tax=Fusarium falciforme TaxID=195108 RepID=UPI0023013A89|nr:F-box domain-containing protein [Fusarium falciforme]WAO97274.1 F-box domain-containing protein [Fusarium falciforme]